MAFCFHVNESLAKGTKRLARKQMDRALDQLSVPTRSVGDEAVHDARRRFKRIRALLRLVRKSLGKRRYNRENACFRDAGRPLTEVRDAQVLVVTFEELTRRFAAQLSGQPFARVGKALLQRKKAVYKRVFGREAALATVVATIRAARRRVCCRKRSVASSGCQTWGRKSHRNSCASTRASTLSVLTFAEAIALVFIGFDTVTRPARCAITSTILQVTAVDSITT